MSRKVCSYCIYECKNKNNKACQWFLPEDYPDDDECMNLVEKNRNEYFDAWSGYVNQYSETFPDLTQLSSK